MTYRVLAQVCAIAPYEDTRPHTWLRYELQMSVSHTPPPDNPLDDCHWVTMEGGNLALNKAALSEKERHGIDSDRVYSLGQAIDWLANKYHPMIFDDFERPWIDVEQW